MRSRESTDRFGEPNPTCPSRAPIGNKNVKWPEALSEADDIYWTYAMARLAAHPSVVLDVSKEAGSSNSGREPSYFINRLKLMDSLNAHQRILTAHSGFGWDNSCSEAPDLCHIMSAQVHMDNSGPISKVADQYYPSLLEFSLNTDVPFVDVEFFYQYGPVDGESNAGAIGIPRRRPCALIRDPIVVEASPHPLKQVVTFLVAAYTQTRQATTRLRNKTSF